MRGEQRQVVEDEAPKKASRSRLMLEILVTVCSIMAGVVMGKNAFAGKAKWLEKFPWENIKNHNEDSSDHDQLIAGTDSKQPETKVGDDNSRKGEEEWENFTFWQLYDYFQCEFWEDEHEVESPIPTQETYQLLRETFYNVVGPENSTIGPPLDGSNGFKYPYLVKQSPNKGRGIFAATDIPKGALVWSNDRAAVFPDASYYRKFLLSLPPNIACDCMQWTYIYDLYGLGKDKKKIMIDLDEGAMCNDGEETDDGSDISNLGWDRERAKKVNSGNGMHFFALRDIKAGEEFLCVYTEFSAEGENDWANHGLDWERKPEEDSSLRDPEDEDDDFDYDVDDEFMDDGEDQHDHSVAAEGR